MPMMRHVIKSGRYVSVFGISKKTVLQLVREFWIPFIISVAWTTYAVWGPDVTVKNIISNFGSSFFLASWLTGQIFRIRKQAGVEASFGSVEQRLNHLVGELETKTQNMISHITGGDSYLYFFPVSLVGTKVLWVAVHKGQYSLLQVKITITDVEMLKGSFKPQGVKDFISHHQLGDFHKGTTQRVADSEFGARERFSFKIVTYSRNGTYEQETRFVKVGDGMQYALRITGPSGVVYQECQRSFPLNANGQVGWDEEHVV
ncbi:hypothetical protein AYO71_22180 [Pseudomonas koreensis]|nr:hypothetical protein AYO71_22180 [Pseudomonas koreensis]